MRTLIALCVVPFLALAADTHTEKKDRGETKPVVPLEGKPNLGSDGTDFYARSIEYPDPSNPNGPKKQFWLNLQIHKWSGALLHRATGKRARISD